MSAQYVIRANAASSNRMHGRRHIRVHGTPCKRTRQAVSKERCRISLREVDGDGAPHLMCQSLTSLLCQTCRLLAPAAAIRRTIIRHLVLILDLSNSMMDRDMRPTRFDLMLQYAREFITEWFDQNPLGQIGIVGMRGGIGERVGEMSGMSSGRALTSY